MTHPTIHPERLSQLDTITLASGSHFSYEDGMCVMEAVAWLTGEPTITDAPPCVSPVLRTFTISLNDQWDEKAVTARAAARDAARAAAGLTGRITARDAGDAARAVLRPTVDALQASALDLLDRMIDPTAVTP